MSAASNYLETALFNHVFRNTSFTSPASLYVALFTSTATLAELEAGTLTNEVTGGSYARQTIAFAAPTNGAGSNSGTITFPTATGSDWAPATHFGVWDASTSGNFIRGAALGASKTVQVGDTASFAASALVLQEN